MRRLDAHRVHLRRQFEFAAQSVLASAEKCASNLHYSFVRQVELFLSPLEANGFMGNLLADIFMYIFVFFLFFIFK